MRRLITTHLDVWSLVTIAKSSSGNLERRLLLPQRLVQVHDVRLHARDLVHGLEQNCRKSNQMFTK